MTATAKSLGIDKLSIEERVSLLGEIWDCLSQEIEDTPVSEEVKELLDKRMAQTDKNPELRVYWEEVRDRALSKLKK